MVSNGTGANMPHAFFALLPLLLLSAFPQQPAESREWLNKGVQAYRNASYNEAIAAFQRAVDLDPEFTAAHLYLGTAWMQRYIPGLADAANSEFARNAELQFRHVLDREPRNVVAVSSLASLAYLQTNGISDPDERARKLDESAGWYQKLVAIDPRNKEGWYTLGVIAWAKWYPADMQARTRIGMKPEDPGPLLDPALRQELRAKYGRVIDDGIENLQKALEIDAEYDEAMAYLNLLYRERGDLADSTQQAQSDVAIADEWLQKTLTTRKNKAEARGPLTPPAGYPIIRINGDPKGPRPLNLATPEYPAGAARDGIQGMASVEVTIGSDGNVVTVNACNGPAVLCRTATEAIRRSRWNPVLVNGTAVETTTTVEFVFSLGGGSGGGGPVR